MEFGPSGNFDDPWDEEAGLGELLPSRDARWDDDLTSDLGAVLADLLRELLRASARPLTSRELRSHAERILDGADFFGFTRADLETAIGDLEHTGAQFDVLGRLYADRLSSSIDEATTHMRRAAAFAERLAEIAASDQS